MSSKRFISSCCLLIGLVAVAAANTYALDSGNAVSAHTLAKVHETWDGAPIAYPVGKPEVTGMLIELAPGAETGWHEHDVPSYAYVLQGNLEVHLRDGRVNRVGPGQMIAEVVKTPHNGRNVGSEPVRLVVFYTGAEGASLSRSAPLETISEATAAQETTPALP